MYDDFLEVTVEQKWTGVFSFFVSYMFIFHEKIQLSYSKTVVDDVTKKIKSAPTYRDRVKEILFYTPRLLFNHVNSKLKAVGLINRLLLTIDE